MTTGLTIRWLDPRGVVSAIGIGGLWLGLTLAFEFGFGRLAAGCRGSELLADYNILAGRVWVFVLVTVFLAALVATIQRR